MTTPNPEQVPAQEPEQLPPQEVPQELPKEVEKQLKAIKKKLDKFSKEVRKTIKETVGISVLPPKEDKKDEIACLVVVDDSDVKFQDKFKFREDAIKKVREVAEKCDKSIIPEAIILEEVWQSCYDGKYDLVQLIANSAPVYDKGMLAAIKITEVHKNMVMKKFERYIVSYVLAGSLVQGRATPESDIDAFVVVDDTDVKKMTRYELREKLRAIIIGMATEAGMMTGIKNKLNIQVYILTDFWEGIKEANPVYFTFLRDGVPFADRGTFMPWKLLLRMGRIKPSPESIEMHMSSGDQMLKRVKAKLNEIGMEDMFWSTLNPSQAALMLYGLPPPTPKETPELLRDIFVKKEGILEEEFVKILENIIETRKGLEHNPDKSITGKEVDKLLTGAEKYLKRIKRLFTQIEAEKEKDSIVEVYDQAVTLVRDALKLEGIEKAEEDELATKFKNNIVSTGKIPQAALRSFQQIEKAKKDFEADKLTKSEVDQAKKTASQFTRQIIDYIQGKRGQEIEKTKVRVKHGKKLAEVTLLGEKAFIVDDLDAKEKLVYEANLKEDGSLGEVKEASMEDFEKALVEVKIPERVFIKQPIFKDLEKRYGKDSEVLITF